MLCNKCGSQIPDDATECEFCGAKVDASANNSDTKVLNTDELAAAAAGVGTGAAVDNGGDIFDDNEKKRREQMEKMMEDKKKQLSEIEKRRNEKRKKQKRKKIAIIALICAAAAGATGLGAHYVIKGVIGNTVTTEQTLPVSSPTPSASPSPSANPSASPSVSPSPSPSAVPTASVSPSGASASGTQNGNGSTTQSWTSVSSGASSPRSGSSSGTTGGRQGGSGSSTGQSSSGTTASSGGSSSSTSSSSSSASGGGSSSQTAYANAADSGIVSDKISAKLVTGGEVIRDSATGKPLMTFVMGGTRYYANVSEGSTTDQVKGKTFTIDADATGESYNGNTIYEISSMTKYEGDYILPNSGTRLLTQSDISGLSKYDLALARNEIYARHGRKFQTAEYSNYFSAKSWYHINPNYNYSDDDGNLNDIERKNVMLILNAEK